MPVTSRHRKAAWIIAGPVAGGAILVAAAVSVSRAAIENAAAAQIACRLDIEPRAVSVHIDDALPAVSVAQGRIESLTVTAARAAMEIILHVRGFDHGVVDGADGSARVPWDSLSGAMPGLPSGTTVTYADGAVAVSVGTFLSAQILLDISASEGEIVVHPDAIVVAGRTLALSDLSERLTLPDELITDKTLSPDLPTGVNIDDARQVVRLRGRRSRRRHARGGRPGHRDAASAPHRHGS